MNKHFEMIEGDSPHAVAQVTQKALITSMRKMIQDMQKDIEAPGLTWEQLDYFLNEWGNKKFEMYIQTEPM
jgi:phosphoribosylaminoimidazole (AIR) synthetase